MQVLSSNRATAPLPSFYFFFKTRCTNFFFKKVSCSRRTFLKKGPSTSKSVGRLTFLPFSSCRVYYSFDCLSFSFFGLMFPFFLLHVPVFSTYKHQQSLSFFKKENNASYVFSRVSKQVHEADACLVLANKYCQVKNEFELCGKLSGFQC